ncbi:MAG: redoxin family protein [Saprospiraceae bacterium]|jgi:peroxiredoxin|nr:redoxin family protein [Saprospiraceae bacterium]
MEEILDNKHLPLDKMVTSEGKNLLKYSFEKPILLIFLRHFGCNFCKASVVEISKIQQNIEDRGFKIVFVHLSDDDTAREFFKKYKIRNAEFISDPDANFYKDFGLGKGTFNQLFGFKTWYRGFETSVVQGHGVGWFVGDGLQMPGVFVLMEGEVKSQYVHHYVSDSPDYQNLMNCCIRL